MKFFGKLVSIIFIVCGVACGIIYFASVINSIEPSTQYDLLYFIYIGVSLLVVGIILAIVSFRKPKKVEPKELIPEQKKQSERQKYQTQAEQGDENDWLEFGKYLERLCEYQEAIKWYQKAADTGLAEAELKVGYFYHNGKGVEKNYHAAYEWYLKAEAQGNLSAIYNIGLLNEFGRLDNKPHPKIAFNFYLKAADQGHLNSLIKVGKAYSRGIGVGKNQDKAIEYLNKAVGQKSGEACYEIALIHLDKKDNYEKHKLFSIATKEENEFADWCKKAADLGFAQAQFKYGEYRYKNRNWDKTTRSYLSQAVHNNIKEAEHLLKFVDEYIAKIEREIREEERQEKERQARLLAAQRAKQQASTQRNYSSNYRSSASSNNSSSSSNTAIDEEKRRQEQKQKEANEALERKRRDTYSHSDTRINVRYYNPHSGFMGMDVYDADADVTFYYKNYYGDTKTRSTSVSFSDVRYNSVSVSDCEYRCQSYLGDY